MTLGDLRRELGFKIAGGAYVLTLFVRMYATLRLSSSQHFVHPRHRSVIPEIEPPAATGPRPVARILDQASSHSVVARVIQFFISLLQVPDVHVPAAHASRRKEHVKKFESVMLSPFASLRVNSAKHLRSSSWVVEGKATAEILRCAQDDGHLIFSQL